MEASIHIAETKLEQRESQLREKEHKEAFLLEEREELNADLQEKVDEISRLTGQLADQEMAFQREQLAMKEMHTLIVRLQDKAA